MDREMLETLNEEQFRAIQHYKNPCMVYAGPGSGKTTVITYRIWYLIHHYKVDPKNILVITFTKAAAEEMKSRFEHIAMEGLPYRSFVQFGTFHSVFYKILRSYYRYDQSNIINEGEKYSLIKNILRTLQIGNADDEELIRDIILDIGLYKNNSVEEEGFQPKAISSEEFVQVLNCYENYKKDHGKIDFDDMLTKCYALLKNQPVLLERVRAQYQYILIDEFQDINSVQFEIIKLIAGPTANLFVVGDDDQSIYSFRGANPRFILEFDQFYQNTCKIVLNTNYRSQAKIIQRANQLIEQNQQRVPKKMKATLEPGVDLVYLRPKDRHEENKAIINQINTLLKAGCQYNEIAIIYRTNILGGSIADALLEYNIPFRSRDQIYNIYEHWVVKDIMSYLSVVMNPKEDQKLARVMNRPTRYIPRRAVENAMEYMDTEGSFLLALKKRGSLQAYQLKYIAKLEEDMGILSGLSTREAIVYIRKSIGYDQYIEGYCQEKQINKNGLVEIMDEFEEAAAKYETPQQLIKHIQEFNASISKNKFYTANSDQVELLTMHSAKGLEFRAVMVIGVVEEVIPHSKSLESEELLEEERRLFYVAITRAKEQLYISSPQFRYEKRAEPSRFLVDMEDGKEQRKNLGKGKEIHHRFFGKGLIEQITDRIMRVRFYHTNEIKDLDIDMCQKLNILL